VRAGHLRRRLRRTCWNPAPAVSTPAITASANQPAANTREPDASRLFSLDLFRGATIALMILINNPGDEQAAYWPRKHDPDRRRSCWF